MTLQTIRKRFTLIALFVIGAGLSMATVSQGGPCTDDTLANYIEVLNSFPNGCTLGKAPLTYYNFQFETLSSVEQSDTADKINVTAAGTDLSFGGFKSLTQANLDLTYLFGFNIDPAPVLTGDSISLDPPFGNVSLSLYVCLPQTDLPYLRGPNPSDPADTNMYCASTPDWGTGAAQAIDLTNGAVLTLTNTLNVDQTGTYTFPTSVSQVGILMKLTFQTSDLSPNASAGATGNTAAVQDQGPDAPEPGTWMLLGAGLSIVLWRRKRSA